MRRIYVWDSERGCSVDKRTGEPMVDPSAEWQPVAPLVAPDIAPYESPVTGQIVDGRRARRYDLESNNCVEAGDIPRKTFKNERFMKKWGISNVN